MNKNINDIEVESIQFVNDENSILLSFSKRDAGKIVQRKSILFKNILAMEIFSDMGKNEIATPYTFHDIEIKNISLKIKGKDSLPSFAKGKRSWKDYDKVFVVLASGSEIEFNLVCEQIIEQ